MKNFILINKSGETISTARAFNLNEAEEIFAIRKNLPVKKLLEIFSVLEASTSN
jgi:hypothetical protein